MKVGARRIRRNIKIIKEKTRSGRIIKGKGKTRSGRRKGKGTTRRRGRS